MGIHGAGLQESTTDAPDVRTLPPPMARVGRFALCIDEYGRFSPRLLSPASRLGVPLRIPRMRLQIAYGLSGNCKATCNHWLPAARWPPRNAWTSTGCKPMYRMPCI